MTFLKKKQARALELLKKGANLFLSGEAGTGKSFVIDKFVEYLDAEHIKYVVCAPTGLAALNIQGSTLHRTFKLSTEIGDGKVDLKNVEEAQVIIIDEISMCRRDIFQYIAKALIEFENPIEEFDIKKERRIVRKKQIVVVGDFFQLPPVFTPKDKESIKTLLKDDEKAYKHLRDLESTLYAFQCKEWEMLNFKSIVLDEVVRQSDMEYIDNLNKLRVGDADGLNFIKKESSKNEIKNAVYLTSRNNDALAINENNLRRINKKEFTYRGEDDGEVIPSDMPVDNMLKLKVGARVMSVVNIIEKDKVDDIAVVNGLLGTVTKLTNDTVTVKFDNGYEHKFEKYKWSIKGFKEIKTKDTDGKVVTKMVMSEVGSYRQIPLKLAWAITIHKSQGQTYESVNLNPNCFCDGQLYVALSRAKDIKNLYLTSALREKDLKTSDVVKEFYKNIEAESLQDKYAGGTDVEVQEVDMFENFSVTLEKGFDNVTNFLATDIAISSEDKVDTVSMDIPQHLVCKVELLLKNEIQLKEFESNEEELNGLRNTVKSLNEEISKLKSELEQTKLSAKRRPKISEEKEEQIIKLRRMGYSMNKISKLVGCGDGTVMRVLEDNNIE